LTRIKPNKSLEGTSSLINEIQNSKALINDEVPSKDLLGLILVKFDENYGYISKYHRCTEEVIDRTFFDSLIHDGLKSTESDYFTLRLHNYECAGKSFHVQNPNKRGNIDIYSFIIFSNRPSIKNIELHEIVDAFKHDIDNYQDILDHYYEEIVGKILPNISKAEPNRASKIENSEIPEIPEIQEIPKEIIEDQDKNNNNLRDEIFQVAIELDPNTLNDYIEQKNFIKVFIINRSINSHKQLLKEYVKICKQFLFEPYFYCDHLYNVQSLYVVNSPAILIKENNEINILDLTENPEEKFDELRRILDKKTRNYEESLQEITDTDILNGSDDEIIYLKENIQWNMKEINEIDVEILSKGEEEIEKTFNGYKYDLTPYNPQNNDYFDIPIHFIYYATDSMELKEKKYYLLIQKISERLDIPISILYLRNYNSIMPKLEPCSPPAVYIHYKKDGKLERKYVEFDENDKYISDIIKILNDYNSVNRSAGNGIVIKESSNEAQNFMNDKIDNNSNFIKLSDEKHIISKIQKFIGKYVIIVLCHKDYYNKILPDFRKKVMNLPLPKVISLSDSQSILYFKIPKDISTDINFQDFIPADSMRLEYTDNTDFNKKLNSMLNSILNKINEEDQ
jgi:hypothetical protein